MIKEKRITIIIIIIILLVVGVIMFLKSKLFIKTTLHINLPASAKIVNIRGYFDLGIYRYDAKILIPDSSIDSISQQLIDFMGEPKIKKDNSDIPNFEITCSWWDLDKDSISEYYARYKNQRILLSRVRREIWAFIYKDDNNQYYLYISY